ncbi:MAG: metal-dependent hydrolase [Bacteroidetes bacterium]|nr:metal-dependent hydrolase [Bacteroidota bacterium]
MEVTYFGHSCFSVRTGGKSILFDPFISPNPLAAAIDVDSLKPDYMLISHGHADHIADAVRICNNSNCKAVGIWEVATWLEKQGVGQTHPMNIGGKWTFDFGTVQMVQAVHSSSLPDGSNGGNAAGFVVQNEKDCFYYAGDTALFSDMAYVGRNYYPKVGFMPIGSNFTMDMYDAAEAAVLSNCREVIGMHYDTFGYIVINHEEAVRVFKSRGITLHLMQIGETREF